MDYGIGRMRRTTAPFRRNPSLNSVAALLKPPEPLLAAEKEPPAYSSAAGPLGTTLRIPEHPATYSDSIRPPKPGHPATHGALR